MFLLFWLSMMVFPHPPATPDLDPSWNESLGRALVSGLRFGDDIVFTYGPLGYFHVSHFLPELFGWKVFWEIVTKALFAFLFTWHLFRLPSLFDRLLFFFLYGVVLLISAESTYLLAMMAVLPLLVENPRAHRAQWAAGMAFLVFLGMVKFTFFAVMTGSVALLLFVRWRAGGRWEVLRLGAVALLLVLLFWGLCGQSWTALPGYLQGSWSITSGYSEAMTVEGKAVHVRYALAVIAACLVYAGLRIREARHRERTALVALALVGTLFVMWKHGFTRHDMHPLGFFAFAVGLPYLLWNAEEKKRAVAPCHRWAVRGLGYAVVLLGLIGLFSVGKAIHYTPHVVAAGWNQALVQNAENLGRLGEVEAWHEAQRRARQAEHDLPRVRAAVGDDGVDLVSYEQAVLFLNGLRWRPRPVFQGYSAYTPYLLERNAAFYRSPGAPPWVLFKLQTIDNRYPAMDDGEALKVLFHAYEPVLEEKGYLLFRRRHGRRVTLPAAETLWKREAAFGETLDLTGIPGRCLLLALDIRPSLLGRARRLLYKTPIVRMEVEGPAGSVARYRIVPDMMRGGVWLYPLLAHSSDVVRLYLAEAAPRPRAVRIVVDPGARKYYAATFGASLLRADGLRPAADPDRYAWMTGLYYPMFVSKPFYVCGCQEEVEVEGLRALQVHAPGEVWFRLSAGTYELTARFGLRPGAYTQGDTDGVSFAVTAAPEGGEERRLFRRVLDPVARPADRGLQSLRVPFTLDGPARVVLRTGMVGNSRYDWSFWEGVRFDRKD